MNIRLAGDSTNIGNNISVLNFSFGILDKIRSEHTTNPNTVTGNFSLGVFQVNSECYEEIRTSLAELLVSLSKLTTTTIHGRIYNVELWLAGDLKFLALFLGS